MAKLTWLGEDNPETGLPGPSFTLAFGGIKFPKGVAVEVRSPLLIQKALTNQFFEVEDADDVDKPDEKPAKRGPGRPPKQGPAAQQAAQLANNQAAQLAQGDIGKAAQN